MRLNCRNLQPAKRLTSWSQNGRGLGIGDLPIDRLALPTNPADSIALKAQTNGYKERSNPFVCSGEVDTQQVANRKRREGRIVQEAKASGKATGYADVDTGIWMNSFEDRKSVV